ncbi:hypothetical protein AAF712_000398 [Marasmius tenuissimus]|uniref:N-acetyltransferase domain-containing protein n=1 Tax=Marasmius tenuissimus TaxID=585030 RepID=A0ABR3AGF6_9AGAR
MPGAILNTTSSFTITVYHKASQISNDVWDALKTHEVEANCLLPTMTKTLHQERNHTAVTRSPGQIWIVCRSGKDVDLLLSCTNNALGTYPIFIVDLRRLPIGHLQPRIQDMAEKLLNASHPERVYSVFAPDDIAAAFAKAWSRLTQINILPKPYYAAKLSYCTKDTFNRSLTQNPAWELRPACDEDLPRVAELCRQFAADSEPFILDEEGAYREAQYLIQSNQVWVHTVSTTHYTDIACIVAFTRNSENNATISKVFTNPEWRGYKCAQRLVARVCRELLFCQGKKSVALFVAHDNGAASKVYHNVGFGGLYPSNDGPSSAPGWTEFGFDRRKVQLGHW